MHHSELVEVVDGDIPTPSLAPDSPAYTLPDRVTGDGASTVESTEQSRVHSAEDPATVESLGGNREERSAVGSAASQAMEILYSGEGDT